MKKKRFKEGDKICAKKYGFKDKWVRGTIKHVGGGNLYGLIELETGKYMAVTEKGAYLDPTVDTPLDKALNES